MNNNLLKIMSIYFILSGCSSLQAMSDYQYEGNAYAGMSINLSAWNCMPDKISNAINELDDYKSPPVYEAMEYITAYIIHPIASTGINLFDSITSVTVDTIALPYSILTKKYFDRCEIDDCTCVKWRK